MTAIALRDVAKRFTLGTRHRRPLYRDLLDALHGRPAKTMIALDGIDLNVLRGQRLGIVGPNGAGKTTLLRIVAGIYRPSGGACRVDGRLACFLEAGVGIAPTLSVLNNIHLYGAIVGLTRGEAKASIDRILEFAELDEFRFSAVEHLSLGMQQRLFFSIMVETMRRRKADVFLFDECLSGTDARFSEKSERLLQEVRHPEQTILYASHNLPHLARICETTIFLNHGQIQQGGRTEEVVRAYLDACGPVNLNPPAPSDG
jgi:ABC-type polysaccharide/polyol phosphate transport system ATPase subunit